MEKLTYCIWAALLTVVLACHENRQYDEQLQRADSLMEQSGSDIVAAAEGLNAIHADYHRMNHRQQMRYRLLQVKARNKLGQSVAGDTVMRDVADYYRRHGTPNERVEALYLLARVYHDQGLLPQAIETYQMADQAADTTRSDCNWKHLFLVHSQLCSIYSEQRMPDYELEELEKMKHLAKRANDTINYILCELWKSDCFWSMGKYENAVDQEQKAIHLMRENGYDELANGSCGTTIWYLISQGKASEARKYMDLYENEAGLFDEHGNIAKGREAYYAYMGKYYLMTGKLDSAEFFFRKVLMYDGERNNKEGGYEGLMQLYSKKHQADSVVKYANLYCKANEKDMLSKSTEKLGHIKEMYDYSQYKIEAEASRLKATRTLLVAVCIVLVLLVVLVILAYVYYIYRKKARKKQEEKNIQYAETYRMYTKLMKERQDEKVRMAAEKEAMRHKSAVSEKEINRLNAIIHNSQKKQQRPEKWSLEASILYSDEVICMHQYAVKGVAPDSLWLDLETKAELFLPRFMQTINDEQYALTNLEQRIALLLKLRFIGGEIQNLLGKSSQSLTNSRANINKKLFKGEGVKGFDEALHALGEAISPPDM